MNDILEVIKQYKKAVSRMEDNMKLYSLTGIAPTVSRILGIPAPAQATGSVIPEITEGLGKYKKVAELVTDALGLYAWQLWKDEMPFLKLLHSRNSIILQSVMCTATPIEFATMVTGCEQAIHGISSKYGDFKCETVFDVIRKNGDKSSGIGLHDYSGSELMGRNSDVCGVYPRNNEESDSGIIETISEIVKCHKPCYLIAQLGTTDDVFHKYGPSSSLVVPMLKRNDHVLKELVTYLNNEGYGVIIHSDHGQHDSCNKDPGVKNGGHGTDSWEDCLVPCTWN